MRSRTRSSRSPWPPPCTWRVQTARWNPAPCPRPRRAAWGRTGSPWPPGSWWSSWSWISSSPAGLSWGRRPAGCPPDPPRTPPSTRWRSWRAAPAFRPRAGWCPLGCWSGWARCRSRSSGSGGPPFGPATARRQVSGAARVCGGLASPYWLARRRGDTRRAGEKCAFFPDTAMRMETSAPWRCRRRCFW